MSAEVIVIEAIGWAAAIIILDDSNHCLVNHCPLLGSCGEAASYDRCGFLEDLS